MTAPRALHQRIENEYKNLRTASSDTEEEQIIDRLLSALGTYRYHVGPSTQEGRKASDRMHALRRRRLNLVALAVTRPSIVTVAGKSEAETILSDVPWD